MADDAAAPDGELSDSAATEEASSATEPETGADETTEVADAEKATDGNEDGDDYDEEALDDEAGEAAPAKSRMSHLRLATIVGLGAGGGARRVDRMAGVPHLPVASGR